MAAKKCYLKESSSAGHVFIIKTIFGLEIQFE
jgi:hypothetical protein